MAAETRQRVTSAGGKARGLSTTPAERTALGRAGANAVHSLVGLAKRLAKRWPAASEAERAEAAAILEDVLSGT